MDASKQVLQLGDRLGFTPSARARMGYQAARGMSIAADLEQKLGKFDDIPETITVED